MGFTKGMTVANKFGEVVAVIVHPKGSNVFTGICISGVVGTYSARWNASAFHPFDLPSAIEEALKTNNHE